jgi:CHASE3 domain sensor protein
VQTYSTTVKNDHDKRFADFFQRIQMNVESIRKLNKTAEDHRHFQDMMITKTENISTRLSKTKEQLLDDLKTAKNDLTLKIEETDKFFNDQVEILQASIERNKIMAKEQLTRAKEDF